jgi:hypothetical protein
MTQVVQFVPVPRPAASPDELRVMIMPRDAAGRRVGPNAHVTVELYPTPPPTSPVGTTNRPLPTGLGSTSMGGSAGPAGPLAGGGTGQAGGPTVGPTTPWPVVSLRTDIDSSGQEDGEFIFIITKTPDMIDDLPTGTMLIRVDGQIVLAKPYSYLF